MTEPEFDKFGYPIEATLQVIRNWDYRGQAHRGLLDFVRGAWNRDYGNIEVFPPYPSLDDNERWVFVTGGWSGNEMLIDALMENMMFYSQRWYQSTRGGRYEFHIWKPPA